MIREVMVRCLPFGEESFGLAGRHRDRIDFHQSEPVETIARSKALYPAMHRTVNSVAISDREDQAQTGAPPHSPEGVVEEDEIVRRLQY